MTFRHAARHLSVRRRLAQRRMRQVLARTSATTVLGPATLLFGAVSVASHAVLTWGMVAIATPPYPDAGNDPLVQSRFLYPLMQQRPRPVQERISYVGIGGMRVKSEAPPRNDEALTGGSAKVAAAPAPQEPVATEPVEAEPFEAFTELEVDVAAERDPESIGPAYPEDLLARKIEGEARVRFIIDSTGRAEEGSFGILETNEPGFAEAVRQALPHMKFRPATIGKKRVPQHVQQSFIFKITPPAIP